LSGPKKSGRSLGLSRLDNPDADVVSHVMRRLRSELLRSGGLQMYYQPILNLRTGLVTRVEALARLRDGSTVHAPGQFMRVLSADDLFELYDRGLGQVLAVREAWCAAGFDIGVSINLPPAAFSDTRYLDATQAALAESSADSAMLTLEILEAEEFVRGVQADREAMKFHALGVKLALDDLGTGHSSLGRLRSLPIDTIKID
jgi:EAL domain-containing protein (putative c-di-GMP-specific phosphodiesterase class I)